MPLDAALDALPDLGFNVDLGLPPEAEDTDPRVLFKAWYRAAEAAGLPIPEAMALATADSSGAPSVRMVLLKDLNEDGFVFFTNYESRKARELASNLRASLCFHWPSLERQVRVYGSVARISQEASFAYFSSRPRGSRIGAWASRQSRPLEGREKLQARVEELTERWEGQEIPLPPHWGGYCLRPDAVEFWQGRTDRLHDRLVFRRPSDGAAGDMESEDAWSTRRLYP